MRALALAALIALPSVAHAGTWQLSGYTGPYSNTAEATSPREGFIRAWNARAPERRRAFVPGKGFVPVVATAANVVVTNSELNCQTHYRVTRISPQPQLRYYAHFTFQPADNYLLGGFCYCSSRC